MHKKNPVVCGCIRYQVSDVMCHVSFNMCHISHVAFHKSQQVQPPTLPLLTPPKTWKPKIISNTNKHIKLAKKKNVKKYANICDTLFDQKSLVYQGAEFHYDTRTSQPRDWIGPEDWFSVKAEQSRYYLGRFTHTWCLINTPLDAQKLFIS